MKQPFARLDSSAAARRAPARPRHRRPGGPPARRAPGPGRPEGGLEPGSPTGTGRNGVTCVIRSGVRALHDAYREGEPESDCKVAHHCGACRRCTWSTGTRPWVAAAVTAEAAAIPGRSLRRRRPCQHWRPPWRGWPLRRRQSRPLWPRPIQPRPLLRWLLPILGDGATKALHAAAYWLHYYTWVPVLLTLPPGGPPYPAYRRAAWRRRRRPRCRKARRSVRGLPMNHGEAGQAYFPKVTSCPEGASHAAGLGSAPGAAQRRLAAPSALDVLEGACAGMAAARARCGGHRAFPPAAGRRS